MASSNARIEANRRNATKSTGPTTAAGKLSSRLNAFKHGMAGAGDVLMPGEDARIVADRAEAFARELGAVGASGRMLAHRAALLSIRADRIAEDEVAAVRAVDRRARADFDEDRNEAIVALLAAAESPDNDPAEALDGLAACPDGLAALLRAWRDLIARLGSPDPGDAATVVARWLGLPATEEGSTDPADLARRAEAELARLRGLVPAIGPATRALEAARADAARQARLDPGPEILRARRYEAAAERGIFRAFRLILDLNRHAGRTTSAAPIDAATPPVASQAHPHSPAAAPTRASSAGSPLASFRSATDESLASFRVGLTPAVAPVPEPSIRPNPPTPADAEARRRPDYRQLAGSRR